MEWPVATRSAARYRQGSGLAHSAAARHLPGGGAVGAFARVQNSVPRRVGLNLKHQEKALVIAVDEKPSYSS
jgi:hypothetical protein